MHRVVLSFLKLSSLFSAYILLPLLMFVSIFDIIGRKFANVGSTQLQELQWHFFFASVMLSIGYAYVSDGHVRIDILRNRFSPKLRKRIEILGCVIAVIPLSVLFIWAGGEQAWRALISGERSAAALGLESRWIIKSVVPIGGILLLLAGIYTIRKNLAALRRPSNDGE